MLAMPTTTVEELLNLARDHYLETRAASSASTWRSHARIIARVWPGLPAASLTRRMIADWVASQAKTSAPATINHRLSFLRAALELAVERGLLAANPVAGTKRARVDNAVFRDLTATEEERLHAYIQDPRDWSLVRFAILTGLRRAEQWRLKIGDVDWKRAGMHVQGSKGTRRRWVPLCPDALGIAQAWAEHSGGRASAYLFEPDRPGDRLALGRAFYHQVFLPAVRAAGLPRTRWHDLRHAFASRLAQMPGVSLYVVGSLLGHTDPKMTQRYSHLQDQHLRSAVNLLV